MDQTYAAWIYDSLMGNLTKEACCPEIDNLFEYGKPCAVLYEQTLEAYWRLCGRLGQEDEDDAGEIMINSLLKITQIVSMKMFEYGQALCK